MMSSFFKNTLRTRSFWNNNNRNSEGCTICTVCQQLEKMLANIVFINFKRFELANEKHEKLLGIDETLLICCIRFFLSKFDKLKTEFHSVGARFVSCCSCQHFSLHSYFFSHFHVTSEYHNNKELEHNFFLFLRPQNIIKNRLITKTR